jgi:hemerythrin
MEKLKVSNGVFWVEIPEADLRILCGCPADSVKLLMRRGLIAPRQKGGVTFETGPNAILLCDSPIQKGTFTNLSEFPVLQMLYRQGMIIPGHPNNTGRRPMLIGLDDQVRSQSEYIFRGNYGLVTEEELQECGVSVEDARAMMRIKRWFAFGKIKPSEELIDARVVDNTAVELAPGVFIHRKGMNLWEFLTPGESLEVDLNLPEGEEYEAPFDLGARTIRREYFSVIHVGEGDGWDPGRPCMGSILCFQGRLFLIDAGPNILPSLTALGIGINEIEGIFHTHCHDDHFAGLASLVRSERRLQYYAAPCVRASVQKKLAALTGIDPQRFGELFDVHDLKLGEWNRAAGLDVKPLYSPHPVDTTVLLFRAYSESGPKLYAHLADLPSFEILDRMVTDDPARDGISPSMRDKFVQDILEATDIKKVDAGGGLIHGAPEDFAADPSHKIILSHMNVPLTIEQKEIGSSAAFGQTDVLIPVQHQTYVLRSASSYLRTYFPEVSHDELGMLINCSIVKINAGSLMIKKGERNTAIYLILSGTAEVIDRDHGFHSRLAAGAMAGELSALADEPSPRTFRAESAISALRVPCDTYRLFISRNGLEESIHRIRENRRILFNTRLFGDMASFTAQRHIARVMEKKTAKKGEAIPHPRNPSLCLLAAGDVALRSESFLIETIHEGDFWGEVFVLGGRGPICQAQAVTDVTYFEIPASALKEYPGVYLKLLESLDRRMKTLRNKFGFEWHELYSVGVKEIDDQHKDLFAMMKALRELSDGSGDTGKYSEGLAALISRARLHFDKEEALLDGRGYPRLAALREEHRKLLDQLSERIKGSTPGPSHGYTAETFFKDWLISHTLLEDRQFRDFMAQPATAQPSVAQPATEKKKEDNRRSVR